MQVVNERFAVAVAALVDVLRVVRLPAAKTELHRHIAGTGLHVAVEPRHLLAVALRARDGLRHVGLGGVGEHLTPGSKLPVEAAEVLPRRH